VKLITVQTSMNYLDRLNDKQREAARCTEGPLLILAGAGSGKTSTMTCRIAFMIEELGVNPYNILAVTFTNKAAKEMRDRVENLVGSGLNMWILTFHSACLRILRSHADVLGYGRDFAVYDPQDQKTLVKNICKELQIDTKKFSPAYFLSIISKCKEDRISPKDYPKEFGTDFKEEMIHKVYQGYETALKKNNAMDFDDLLLNAVRVFEQDESVLRKYQNRFRYIMVDEYQDTNQIQYTFVRMLAEEHRNICVVGDDDQCIYQWRGADIRNILEFEKDFPGAKVVKLEQNYRSTGNILDAAHSVICHNSSRKKKKLWTQAEGGSRITYLRARDEREEATYIASEIGRLTSGGYTLEEGRTAGRQYKDFAILYRTNAQSRTFEEALSRRDIPYRVLGGLRYYDRKEVKDIMCYMRLVQNHQDDLALARIINEPLMVIGGETTEKLQTLARVRGESLFETLLDEAVVSSLSAKAGQGVRELTTLITQLHEEQDNMRISDIYDGLLVRSGYLKMLEDQNTFESESRIENLMEFKSVIFDYEEEDPNITLPEFMERIALLADVDNHDADENAVVLMTLHSAKGLEFPFVFMPGMEDGLFPGWRAFDRPDGLEEERRLCYVGITRAKERLWMTSAEMRTLYGKTDFTRESVFMREIDPKLLEGDGVYQEKQRAQDGFQDGGFSGGGFSDGRFGGTIGGGTWGNGSQGSSYGGAQGGFRNGSPIGDSRGGSRDGVFRDGVRSATPIRPYDQLKYARQMTKQNAAAMQQSAEDSFAPGDRVKHSKFGEGQVLYCDGKIIRVRFAEGEKKLAIGYAPLKKLT